MLPLNRLLRRCVQTARFQQTSSVTTIFQYPAIETDVDIKPFSAIPGPIKLPYFKSSWAFLPYIGRYDMSRLETSHSKLYEDYGEIVRLEYPGPFSVVMLYDPKLFQRVNDIEGLFPRRLGFVFAEQIRRTKPSKYPNVGLIMLWGDKWRDLRHSTHKPMLRFPSVRQLISPMDQVMTEFIGRLQKIRNKNLEIDVFDELSLWAVESLGVFTLNKRFDCFENPKDNDGMRMHQAAYDVFEYNGELEFNAGWKSHFSKTSFAKASHADDVFTNYTYKFISDALYERSSANQEKEHGPSLLDSLLSEKNMNLEKLKGIMLDLFLAGSTTVASVNTFLLYYLASQKIQQERLYEEIVRELPTRDSPVTSDTLDKMVYLRACVKENIRLHPVVVGTGRSVEYDVSIAGYHIPQGTIIISVTPLTSRMEKYFELPNDFVPERWLIDSPEAEMLRKSVGLQRKYTAFIPHSTVPFGHGVRMCAGRRFAEQETFMLLIRLLQNFSLDFENQKPLEMKQGFLNMPAQPIRIKLTERK